MSTPRVFSGHAANTDIVVALAHAYLHALNRLHTVLQTGQAVHLQREMVTAAL
ncbi:MULTISPECIES: hypothetical protein [Cyanophyceae]|uniref:Uncharacterized protein n=1 Tax=Leptolyngbya subtilissima DQ-A4 TaxID=2933933 RepID=A0ABV0K033_9CYAN|nr:hypothetical protein [Nodosilinea sp. FACHB-141]MBD2112484.1 hypothetical protein [Nodosilinea sp. FACHB-141]